MINVTLFRCEKSAPLLVKVLCYTSSMPWQHCNRSS